MLDLQNLRFDGHHGQPVPPTTFTAVHGGLSLIEVPTAMGRTALTLICTGRMRPDGGSVAVDELTDPRLLRRAAAPVDSPGVTAPEHHMRVRHLVSETLALRPSISRPWFRGTAGQTKRWLAEREVLDLSDEHIDALSPELRLWLLVELAFSDPLVRVAVADSPDRHGLDPEQIRSTLAPLADPGSDRTVVAVVQHAPQEAPA